MKAKKLMVAGLIATTVAAVTGFAASTNETFRATGSVGIAYQFPAQFPPGATNLILQTVTYPDSEFVALALGTNATAEATNDVLAFEIDCGSTVASLVVFDKATSNDVITVATSTKITALTAQDSESLVGPNHERFVIDMDINTNGFLIGGSLTVAGRMYLDPTNGCPRVAPVDTDNKEDKLFGDTAIKDTEDKKDKSISGEAHLIGVADVVDPENGSTNTILLPFGHVTLRRELLP
jgi:hypothetical protein